MTMKLLYCYIQFLNDKGEPSPYHGQDKIELNLSTTNKYSYNIEKNELWQKDRETPLPADFWSDNNTGLKHSNINNINVIAGENGSGKTTAIRCIMNLLDFFHAAADINVNRDRWNKPQGIAFNRSLLLFENKGSMYLLNYVPESQSENNPANPEMKGFTTVHPLVFSCHSWKEFANAQDPYRNAIANLLKKTKIIYLTNTLTQYDYEQHIEEQNERRRHYFIYDVSLGSVIGENVGKFFPYEVYKQVKYVFDKNQVKKRSNIPEFTMPHKLQLQLRLDEFKTACSTFGFPSINEITSNQKTYDLTAPLGLLCVASFITNLRFYLDSSRISMNKSLLRISYGDYFFFDPLYHLILETEIQFYEGMHFSKSQGHSSIITCVSVLPDGRIISGSYDKTLQIWDPSSGKHLQTIRNHKGAISFISPLSNGRFITGSRDTNLMIWDSATENNLLSLKGHTSCPSCIIALPDGRIVSGSYDSTIRLWDSDTGKCLNRWHAHSEGINCIAVLSKEHIVSGSADHTLRIWDINTGDCLNVLNEHAGSITCVDSLCNNQIISGSTDGTLKIWDAITGECLRTLKGHSGSITCMKTLSENRVVSGSSDKTLKIWNTTTGELLRTLQGHSEGITCIVPLPNNHIVSGSRDHTLRIWDINSGNCLYNLEGHTDAITCVTLTPNKYIISGSADNTLKVWNLSGNCLHTLQGDFSTPDGYTVIPDGRAVSASRDHRIEAGKTTNEQLNILYLAVKSLRQNCINYLNFLIDKHNSLFSKFTKVNNNTFEISLDSVNEKESTYQELIEFVQKYRYTCEPTYTIDFNWGLSSGEENLLRIFSNLYQIFDRDYSSGRYGDYKIYNNESHAYEDSKKDKCDTILLFMDEADLTLHPEWQRRLIAILTAFIPQIYPRSCIKDIQLILTTHSPLLLGDIPNDNITYLYSKKSNALSKDAPTSQTFGQNIHTILKDSFFLSKGTVGAFAAKKINNTAKRLKEIKTWADGKSNAKKPHPGELEEIRKIINLVAPGVLQVKLNILLQDAETALFEMEVNKLNQKNLNFSLTEQILQVIKSRPLEERLYIQKVLNQEEHRND